MGLAWLVSVFLLVLYWLWDCPGVASCSELWVCHWTCDWRAL